MRPQPDLSVLAGALLLVLLLAVAVRVAVEPGLLARKVSLSCGTAAC
jgi:hypothetical protein